MTINGDNNTIYTQVGAIVSVPTTATGAADDTVTTLQPTTISWQQDADGFLQYSTNDSSLSGSHIHTNNTIQATMSSVEMQVKKNSGDAHAGYGVIFCYQGNSNHYGVLITINGHYLITKAVSNTHYYYSNGSWTTTNPSWPTSSNLITGYGNINDIKVVNAGGGAFNIYFNGTLETTFTDSTFTGGDSGYEACISASSENFPTTPEDMHFKQIDPALSTAYSVQNIRWQNDGTGFVQFLTNDTNNCGNGYYHWAGSASYTPMSTLEMQVKKMSGYSGGSYGIIFCVQDDNNFYRILITVNGSYVISKKASGTYSYYLGNGAWSTTGPSPWPTSGSLITGYGNINDIKVVNAGGGTFDLYFNGTLETTFTDSTFTGGHHGYYIFIGTASQESFPTPVDVRLKLIAAD